MTKTGTIATAEAGEAGVAAEAARVTLPERIRLSTRGGKSRFVRES